MANDFNQVQWDNKRKAYFPTHRMVQNWMFKPESYTHDSESAEKEANLADALAYVAEDNGLTVNDLQHLFPAILRMLKSNSAWTK